MSTYSNRRVVITGMAGACSLGLDVDTTWARIKNGESGFRLAEELPEENYKTRVWADVNKQQLREAVFSRGMKKSDPALELAQLVTYDALDMAGLREYEEGDDRKIAALFGCGAGMVHTQTEAYLKYADKGPKGVRPTTVPRCMMNYLSAQVSLQFGLRGPNQMIVAACSSSTIAIGQGARMIRDGYIDQAVCGGTEALLEPALFAAWDRLGIMDRSNNIQGGCRPFDAERKGTLLGEGAGVLVLEDRESALARGATIYGEILGYGETSDASHLVQPNPNGQLAAMIAALEDAGLEASAIDCINAQGTGTTLNDTAEAESVGNLLGQSISEVPVFSLKSYVGHLLGGAGALESVLLLKALREGYLPGNLNLEKPEASCNLNLVPADGQGGDYTIAMKNSFAFGGSNAVLVFQKGD